MWNLLRIISFPISLAKKTNTLIMFDILHSNDWKSSDRPSSENTDSEAGFQKAICLIKTLV